MATTMLNLPEELVTDIFSKVKGHSAIAKLSAQKPMPFNGIKEFVFSMPGEASIVAEGALKPASEAAFTPKVIRPIKFVYQVRVSDEFMNSSDEARLPYLEQFGEGFAIKIGRGLDIAAMHGIDPKTKVAVSGLENFDGIITSIITYDANHPDDNLDDAIAAIVALEASASGIAVSPAFGTAMSRVKVNGVVQYPEFRFGGAPDKFAGYSLDMNNTLGVVATGTAVDHAIVGDFENAFRWGYSKNIPLEIIQYGDPDGTGRDLKAYNEVCLRGEAYIGWGILDKDSFAVIRPGTEAADTGSNGDDNDNGEGGET